MSRIESTFRYSFESASGLLDRSSFQGYIWGHSVDKLTRALPTATDASNPGFHLIILSDLIFNHSQVSMTIVCLLDHSCLNTSTQHDALLKTCETCLVSRPQSDDASVEPCVLVFYSHHRPRLADRDLEFFRKAQAAGWACEEIVTRKYPVCLLHTLIRFVLMVRHSAADVSRRSW